MKDHSSATAWRGALASRLDQLERLPKTASHLLYSANSRSVRCPQDYSISLLSCDSVCKCAQYSCYIHVGSKPKQKQWTSFLAHTRILPTTLKTFFPAHTHSSFYARDTFSSTYAHTSGYRHLFVHSHIHTSFYARDILSWIYKHTSCFATDVFCCTYAHTSCVAICIFSCTYPRTVLDATRETSFLAHTQGGKTLCFEESCPCKTQSHVTMGLQNPRVFQGAILTWHDYGTVVPSTFDSKTWATASAIVTPPGCLCPLGFTETIPVSFKKFARFALLNSNKTKAL